MTIIAEFRVSGRGVTLLPALQAAPGVTLDLERTVVDDGEMVHFLWASGTGFDAFEDAAADDPTVEEFERFDETDDERFYRVVVRLSEVVDIRPFDRAVSASRISLTASAKGIDIRMRFPDSDAMSTYFDRLREEGLDVTLRTVYHSETGREGTRFGLSEKQIEALQTAHAEGYFDVPRDTGLTELAEELDISRQATSERLRRGMASVLEHTVVDGIGDENGDDDEG